MCTDTDYEADEDKHLQWNFKNLKHFLFLLSDQAW